MKPWSQLIFDKSDLVRSRTKKYKYLSYMLKLKNAEVLFINGYQNLVLHVFQ
jgi:hypothetical protein